MGLLYLYNLYNCHAYAPLDYFIVNFNNAGFSSLLQLSRNIYQLIGVKYITVELRICWNCRDL